MFYPQVVSKQILQVGDCVTSPPCWGRVVIGSNRVYQTRSTGSNPVASTTVLTVSARSIGNGQKRWISFAWEGLERSGPFLIPSAYRGLFFFTLNRGNLFSIEGIGGLGVSYRDFVQTVYVQNASNDW